jgi:hypothetical protein
MTPRDTTRQRFRRRPDQSVAAVQIKLDTEGLRYRKWEHDQFAKPGDWLVDNGGDVYSVDAESFARTYRQVGRGAYVKSAPVWAEQVTAAGSVATKEGTTEYAAGDWLVSNAEDGSDAYAIKAGKFETLYEPDN